MSMHLGDHHEDKVSEEEVAIYRTYAMTNSTERGRGRRDIERIKKKILMVLFKKPDITNQ